MARILVVGHSFVFHITSMIHHSLRLGGDEDVAVFGTRVLEMSKSRELIRDYINGFIPTIVVLIIADNSIVRRSGQLLGADNLAEDADTIVQDCP